MRQVEQEQNLEMSPKPLTIKQLRQYPPEALRIDAPEATSEGHAKVAEGRGGPLNLHYKLFGHGPARIVWISDHGAGIEDWYDLVRIFGVENGDKYTSLVFEHSEISKPEAPWSFPSIKHMAQNTADLLTHLGWTEDRKTNVVGHAMGGMVALELSTNPSSSKLLHSLTLLSTTSNWRRDLSLLTATRSALTNLLASPLRNPDSKLTDLKLNLLSPTWLSSADLSGTFPTNGDRWAALHHPSLNPRAHTRTRSANFRAPAAVRFKVPDDELKQVAERLGKGKVLIVQGWDDKIVPVGAAERMWEAFGGRASGRKSESRASLKSRDGPGSRAGKSRQGERVDAGHTPEPTATGGDVKIVVLNGVAHCPNVEAVREVGALIDTVINGDASGTSHSRAHSRAMSASRLW